MQIVNTKDVERYQAFIQHPAKSDDKIILGILSYHREEQKLFLLNKHTSLEKKILLLGYSKKAETQNVIGQFGEGLKVGALALVREGRIVIMETSDDRWQFNLDVDQNFGEKVLSIIVTGNGCFLAL